MRCFVGFAARSGCFLGASFLCVFGAVRILVWVGFVVVLAVAGCTHDTLGCVGLWLRGFVIACGFWFFGVWGGFNVCGGVLR